MLIRHVPPATVRQAPACRALRRNSRMSPRLDRTLIPRGGRKRTAVSRSAADPSPP